MRWRESVKFAKTMGDVLVGLVRFIWFCVWRKRKGFNGAGEDLHERSRRPRIGGSASGHVSDQVNHEVDRRRNDRELYQRFLRGEDISDDDEDVVVDESDSTSDSGEGEEVTGSSALDKAISVLSEEFDQHERQEEAIALFTDLVKCQGVEEGSRLVWGHLARATGRESPPGPPLTRNKWSELRRKWGFAFVSDVAEDVWEADGSGSRMDSGGTSENGRDIDLTDRATCIICTSRPRDVISWPCR